MYRRIFLCIYVLGWLIDQLHIYGCLIRLSRWASILWP